MNIVSTIFYFLETVAALAAIGILIVRNVFYAALLLLVTLLCVAGIYVLSFAEFIAVTQILVYAGGVLVLIIFGIMLTSRISGKPLKVSNTYWFVAVLVGGFFFVLLANLFLKQSYASSVGAPPPGNTMQQVGVSLMSDFILPFEVAGILLLVALIGAAVTASFMTKRGEDVSH